MTSSRRRSWQHWRPSVQVRKWYRGLRRSGPSLSGFAALVFSATAAIVTWFLAVPAQDWALPEEVTHMRLAIIGIVFAGLGWVASQFDRRGTRLREREDMDGLTAALEKVLPTLHEATNESPDSPSAKSYVQTVLDALRERLEPNGQDDTVRVNLYRRDQEEETEEVNGGVMRFNLYACSQGGRTDIARQCFQDDEAPGKHFMPELKRNPRYVVTNRSELYRDDAQHPVKEPAYGSFVNLALRGSDGEPYAMLTVDSIHEFYFSPRQERLIRAFQQLIELALTYSTKDSDVPRPAGLQTKKGGRHG